MNDTNQSERKNTGSDDNQREDAATGCCGGPAPADSGACCALDAEVKTSGGAGCGCASRAQAAAPTTAKKGCC